MLTTNRSVNRDVYPMLLVANKVDLVHLRTVSEEAGRELAQRLGIPYIETSAKDPPLNVDQAFQEVSMDCCAELLVYKHSAESPHLYSGCNSNHKLKT